jgi:hypothetical protein
MSRTWRRIRWVNVSPLAPCRIATFQPRLTTIVKTATGEPEGILYRTSDRYKPGIADSDRINATLLALVRNEELEDMISSMKDLERTWNHKFNYPWTFFNDVPFTAEFKRRTQAATKAECIYGESGSGATAELVA